LGPWLAVSSWFLLKLLNLTFARSLGCGRDMDVTWTGSMRRQTSTVNYAHALPLAQGIAFEI
jgi:hypothetical protein